MESIGNLSGLLRTSYQRRHLLPLLSVSIVVSLAASSCVSTNPTAISPAVIVMTAQYGAPSATATNDAADSYQPRDHGGPGKTGGSGTRYSSAITLLQSGYQHRKTTSAA